MWFSVSYIRFFQLMKQWSSLKMYSIIPIASFSFGFNECRIDFNSLTHQSRPSTNFFSTVGSRHSSQSLATSKIPTSISGMMLKETFLQIDHLHHLAVCRIPCSMGKWEEEYQPYKCLEKCHHVGRLLQHASLQSHSTDSKASRNQHDHPSNNHRLFW